MRKHLHDQAEHSHPAQQEPTRLYRPVTTMSRPRPRPPPPPCQRVPWSAHFSRSTVRHGRHWREDHRNITSVLINVNVVIAIFVTGVPVFTEIRNTRVGPSSGLTFFGHGFGSVLRKVIRQVLKRIALIAS